MPAQYYVHTGLRPIAKADNFRSLEHLIRSHVHQDIAVKSAQRKMLGTLVNKKKSSVVDPGSITEAARTLAQAKNQWRYKQASSRVESGQAVLSYGEAMSRLKTAYQSRSRGNAIKAVVELLASISIPNLNTSLLNQSAEVLWNDFVAWCSGSGEKTIFGQIFSGTAITREMMQQIMLYIDKYFGFKAGQFVWNQFAPTFNQLKKMKEILTAHTTSKKIGKEAQTIIKTMLDQIDEALAQGSKYDASKWNTTKFSSSAAALSSTNAKGAIKFMAYALVGINPDIFGPVEGQLGELIQVVDDNIFNAYMANLDMPKMCEAFGDYHAKKLIQSMVPGSASGSKQTGFNKVQISTLVAHQDIIDEKARKSFSKYASNVSTATDGMVTVQQEIQGKKDTEYEFMLNINDTEEPIALGTSVKATMARIWEAGRGTGQSFDIQDFASFVRSQLPNTQTAVTVQSSLSGARLVGMLREILGEGFWIGKNSEQINNLLKKKITFTFADELIGGYSSSDYAAIFSVNGISVDTYTIIQHISKMSLDTDSKALQISGNLVGNAVVPDNTFANYITSISYRLHLNMNQLLADLSVI